MKDLKIKETYASYESIPPAKKAWITIKAKEDGKNPVMVHAGYKAYYKKVNGK